MRKIFQRVSQDQLESLSASVEHLKTYITTAYNSLSDGERAVISIRDQILEYRVQSELRKAEVK